MRKLILLNVLILSSLLYSCETGEDGKTKSIVINNGDTFLSFDSQARSGKINVASIQPWNVTTDAEWIELSTKSGNTGGTEIVITLEENAQDARSATLKFNDGQSTVNFVVSQSKKDADFDSPTHYFYITAGTMPTLYAGLFLLSHELPSHVFYERTKTFDPLKFPSYATITPYLGGDDQQIKMRDYMKSKILEINEQDPTAVFGLLVDDLRSRLGYDWFVAQGIDSSRVKVTMVSDGTGTYNEFYKSFGDAATGETTWKEYVSIVDGLNWNHDDKYPVTRILGEFDSWSWCYYQSTLPNYRMLLQYGSLLETSSTYVQEQITKMKMVSTTPYEMLAALPKDKQDKFYEMADFDYTKYADIFDKSPKENLVIIGTNGQDDAQRNYTERIYLQYNEQYDIFFKPHPSDLSSAEYETDFPGLTLLPGQMPFEIFVWSLNDKIKMIGGFSSTVFLTVPVEKVGFIFAPSAQSMAKPLNLLFKDASGVEWIQ